MSVQDKAVSYQLNRVDTAILTAAGEWEGNLGKRENNVFEYKYNYR